MLVTYRGLADLQRDLIQAESEALDQPQLFLRTEATVGLVFGTAGIVALVGFIALVGRICNQDSGSSKKIFTCLVSTSLGYSVCVHKVHEVAKSHNKCS